jgi:hypothetical protein
LTEVKHAKGKKKEKYVSFLQDLRDAMDLVNESDD